MTVSNSSNHDPSYVPFCSESSYRDERASVPKAAIEHFPINYKVVPTKSRFSPWLLPLAYPLGTYGLVPLYFGRVRVTGQENLPKQGPILLTPTHRSRWDCITVPYAAGWYTTGRHLRFMVTADEVKGLQGWFIRRMGGFPIDVRRPAIASLRHGVELLQNNEVLVIFPEGGIFRDDQVHPLKAGPARIALQAESSQPGLGVNLVPIHVRYDAPYPTWGCNVDIRIGKPLAAADYHQGTVKENAQQLTADLTTALKQLNVEALEVGF